MTKKISLVLDEEQAMFTATSLMLGAACVVPGKMLVIPEIVSELIAMTRDGSVKMQTVHGLIDHVDTICGVFDTEEET